LAQTFQLPTRRIVQGICRSVPPNHAVAEREFLRHWGNIKFLKFTAEFKVVTAEFKVDK
jgi:hypothetical protein